VARNISNISEELCDQVFDQLILCFAPQVDLATDVVKMRF
jgi:hypothetical protein